MPNRPKVGENKVTKYSQPAICVAMSDEATPFLEGALHTGHEEAIGGASFRQITLSNGTSALLVTSGIGLVNAATAATIAVTQFDADVLISSGSAGGVGKQVGVGDIVIGNRALFAFADATAFGGYVLGQIPKMPKLYEADVDLTRAALSAAALSTAANTTSAAHTGLVISGDAFIWQGNYGKTVEHFPLALAADMETAAIAQVAYKFNKPWIAIRGISDLCGPAAADDFITHVDDAAERAAAVIDLLFTD